MCKINVIERVGTYKLWGIENKDEKEQGPTAILVRSGQSNGGKKAKGGNDCFQHFLTRLLDLTPPA